jgi:hypothetical protein
VPVAAAPAPVPPTSLAPIEPLPPTGRTSADVLAGPDAALTGNRVAPVAVFVLLLWILRRVFGSGKR